MLFAEANAYRIQCLRNIGMKLSSGKQVGMGIPFFLNFAPKHRLWVLVRTASARRSEREPTIYVCVLFSVQTFSIITNLEKICILHGHVFVTLDNGCLYRLYFNES